MKTIEQLRASHARVYIGPLTKAAILAQVDELTAEWRCERDPAAKERIDRRIDVLLSLIRVWVRP